MRWLDPPIEGGDSPIAGLPPLLGRTLLRRGIATAEAAGAFLNPDSYSPAPASDLPGMDRAVARIADGIRARVPICVWGDFDVDGQTATAILVSSLTALGADVTYHLPVRATEGHGVDIARLAEIIDSGVKLILTCDTGSTAHDAVEFAHARGADVVITDHHDLDQALPAAEALVNPKLLRPDHPLATLAGAGVAYKLAEALLDSPSALIQPSSLLDLVALGLIADLALLRADTRYLVQRGLHELRRTERTGLKAMMELARIVPGNLNEEHVGFEIAPRLNALGRLGDANPAVELLLTTDAGRARVIATQLEGYNAQRKLLTEQVYQAAEAQLRDEPALLDGPVVVLAHQGWHGGVIGLAATRIARRYGKPTLLFSIENGVARGSARSIEGLHITQAIAAQRALLRSFGGHPMAAGLALDSANLPRFRQSLARTVGQMLAEAKIEEDALQIDGWLELPEINLDMTREIEQLAPFGPGNEKLILVTRNLRVRSATAVGRNTEHLKLTVEDQAGSVQTVLWWNGAGEPVPEGLFDLAFTLRTSDFRGTPQVTAEFVDWRELAAETPVEIKPVRRVDDWRSEQNPQDRLKRLLAEPGRQVMVWAEGDHKKSVKGLGRHELKPADTLVIWTAPAARAILQAALEQVQPKHIVLVAAEPQVDEPKAFLERLAGIIKFAVQHRGGRATWDELASATAQREAAVYLGLEWLAKRGEVTGGSGPGGELVLTTSASPRDDSAADETAAQLQKILAETAAYRSYFMRAENPVE
jgi:single-stranded-DNA-specific exonuclease